MKKNETPSFIVQFPLNAEQFQIEILNKRMEIGRQIYNALLTTTLRRYREMVKTREYRNLMEQLRQTASKLANSPQDRILKKDKDAITTCLNDLRERYRINEFAFHEDVKPMQHHFKDNIDSFTAQKIASRLWLAYEDVVFGKGKELHYKKFGQFNSLEGKSNGTGIRFKEGRLIWNGLEMPVIIDHKNPYEVMAFKNKIAFCRIVRRHVRGKIKFYLQIVFKGFAPPKIDKATGEFKRCMGKGDVGLDIGTQTVAIISESSVNIYELADKVQNIENEKRRLLRKQDRSRRATNPNNFNEDGTSKKQGGKKVEWIRSNHYLETQEELREVYRKQAAVRRMQHSIQANDIVKLGNNVKVEKMNFQGLQRRAKITEKNDKGEFKRKKRFGKSIANKAPAMFLTILDNKLKWHGTQLYKVDTRAIKASQYNHITEECTKKKLSQRWVEIDGKMVQRDMYSSFLVMNVDDTLKKIDNNKCNERFEKFLELHDKEVKRLTGQKNLSSIAI
ncbi:MAG: transposase [Oscillospiraceae bacterium]|nr:transposase [Oscillospiraceae bacterium]